jgi:nitroreductase
METLACIAGRVSVRKYRVQAISKEQLIKLVDAGRRAPSARAVEPWEFVVITDTHILAELGKIAENGAFIKEAAACIAVYCHETKYYLEDGSAATENILLAAHDAGIGACWVAGDKKPYVGDVGSLLAVPADMKLISLISLGWPRTQQEQQKKRSLSEITHWEKF